MKLTGEFKEKADRASNLSEKRHLIEEAGMKLTDDELETVAGGIGAGRLSIEGWHYNKPDGDQD